MADNEVVFIDIVRSLLPNDRDQIKAAFSMVDGQYAKPMTDEWNTLQLPVKL